MLLRASGEMTGNQVDVSVLVDASAAADSGIPAAPELIAFAEAVLAGDAAELGRARAILLELVGADGLVDAAGVVGNFQRMVRIADSTGIPLDAPVVALTGEISEELGLDAYASASNTPQPSASARLLGKAMAPIAGGMFRLLGKAYRRG